MNIFKKDNVKLSTLSKRKKLDLINNSKQFIPVKIVDDSSHDTEVTMKINNITIKVSLNTLKALLGGTFD